MKLGETEQAADTGRTERRRFGWVWIGVVLHAFVIAVMASQLLWWDLHPTIDANIGAGFLTMAVTAAGFPWSMAVWTLLDSTQTSTDVALIAAAGVNLALHAAFIWWLDTPEDG